MLGLRMTTRWNRCVGPTLTLFKRCPATRSQGHHGGNSVSPPGIGSTRANSSGNNSTATVATLTTFSPVSEAEADASDAVAKAADRKAERVLGILESAFPDAVLPPLQVARSPSIHFREDAAFDLWWEYEAAGSEEGSGQLWYSMYKKFSDLTPSEQLLVDQPGSRLQSVKKRLGRRGKKKKYSQSGRRRRTAEASGQELDDHRKCRMLMREFPRASKPINDLMPRLLDFLQYNKELQHKCFQVRFRSTLHQKKVMVLLLYHRPIETPEFRAATEELLQAFPNELATVVGRAKRQLVQTPRDFLVESYCLPPATIERRVLPHDWELVRRPSNGFQLETCLRADSSPTTIVTERSASKQPRNDEDVVRLEAHTVVVEQPENCFIQPNAHVCTRMLMWARETIVRHRLRKQQGDSACYDEDSHSLLELHCGIGTFTLALAPFFHRTFATELNRRSVEALGRNVARTFPLPNRSSCTARSFDPAKIFFTATPAQDIASTLVDQAASQYDGSQRPPPVVTLSPDSVFQAEDLLELDGEMISSQQTFNFRTVFVDPPRSGLDATTLEALQLFPEVMYISCNPESLERDLKVLSNTHVVQASGFFDQFPWSSHIESGVLLERRDQVTFQPGDF